MSKELADELEQKLGAAFDLCERDKRVGGHRVILEVLQKADQLVKAMKAPSFVEEECSMCDGVGWYEGGAALQNHCNSCNGTGVVRRAHGTDSEHCADCVKETLRYQDGCNYFCEKHEPAVSTVTLEDAWQIFDQEFTKLYKAHSGEQVAADVLLRLSDRVRERFLESTGLSDSTQEEDQ